MLTGRPLPAGRLIPLWPKVRVGTLRLAAPHRLRAPLKADWVPWLIALAVFAAYTTISLSRYFRLDPGSWDLGIFTEYVRQLAHLRAPVVNIHGAGFNLLGDHFQPIVGPDRPRVPALPQRGHPAGGPGPADRGLGHPGEPRGRGPARHRGRADDRRRVRVLLGPPADDRLRLPRDRVRGPVGGLLPVRAVAGQAPRRGGVGAATGVREGGPGLHGRGHRHPHRGDEPRPRPARTARTGPRCGGGHC